ncbi:hypothetical protein [Hymenobacter daeguensis]
MLRLISDPKQVKKLYAEFRQLLESKTLFPVHRPDFHIGHRGGTAATDADYSPQLDVWTSPGNLQWNAFGVGKSPSMVVQINFQEYALKPRRVGAAFALDEADNPVVIHRGHLGGGKTGVGLSLMLNECRAEHVWLREEDGQETECFVVGQLRSRFFAQQLATFVWEVHRVKTLGSVSGLSGIAASLLPIDTKGFTTEKTGTGTRITSGPSELTHGLVVNELAKRLGKTATRHGWEVRNDRHRDLMLTEGNRLRVLFEVKTGVSTQSICTGLGQLLLYSAAEAAGLVLVLPEKLPADVVNQLNRWKVQVLYYSWNDTTPRFRDLSKLLARL